MDHIDSFHYPPDLFQLLVDVIPLLNKSKVSVLTFFRGAGISESIYKDISQKVKDDRDGINKYDITRTILTRINEDKDKYIRERRELLKRVVEFEAFSNCWEGDQYKAKGLVAEIRNVVNVKDSFTRMQQEREKEQAKHRTEYNNKVNSIRKRAEELETLKKAFYALFGETDHNARGKKLENVLNSLFSVYGILVREAFTRSGEHKEGIIEQIDGVVEIDHKIYLVETKWTQDKIGGTDVYAHLARMYHRTDAHGIYISASGYSDAGKMAAKEALLKDAILILTDLEEFVSLLNEDKDLVQYFKAKIQKAIIDKNPYTRP